MNPDPALEADMSTFVPEDPSVRQNKVFKALKHAWGPEGIKRFFAACEELNTKRFSADKEPPRSQPRFFIHGKPVSTSGNLTNIIAQSKVGKSATVGALIAAVICAENSLEGDTLGFTASAPGSKQLLHIDTEQSDEHHYDLVMTALKRAGANQDPLWLYSFALAGQSADKLRESLSYLLAMVELAGGVFAVILDGAADMVNDVNNAKECNPFVAELQGLALKHRCPFVCVVHENPNADTGKIRGHLGSQLERKAESNLRLKKVDGVTVIFSEKQRRAPILEKDGPRFVWSDQHGMHVSVATAGQSRDDAKRAELVDLADEVFQDKPNHRHNDLTAAIMKARDCSKKTAERKINEMKGFKVITKEGFGMYSPSNRQPPSNAPS